MPRLAGPCRAVSSPPAQVLFLTLTLLAIPAAAQRQALNLTLPDASPRAEVAQTVGVADVRVVYFRPAVNGRAIWGGLVPYGQVWRTGANENTIVSFSHDVEVEGQPLAAGTYGLHTQPGEASWEVIFSRDTTAWGSFSYDQANDALRVTAAPQTAPHLERLAFSFDDVGEDSATLALRWETLRLPVRLEFDTQALTLASIDRQLKGLSQFFWVGWDAAANWALTNETAYEQALGWADRSIAAEERFENLSTKAQLLERTGKTAEAGELLARAVESANALQLHNYGRQLIGQGKKDEALAIFQRNAEKHPETWFVDVGLARGLSALGRFPEATEAMRAGLGKAPEDQKAYVQGLVDRLAGGQDVN